MRFPSGTHTLHADSNIIVFFLTLILILICPTLSHPTKFDPNLPNFKLQQCRCDGWDGGPNNAACFLVPWDPSFPDSWTGAPDQWICATYNERDTCPDNDMWYECRTARGIRSPDAKMCEACAQSGSGATTLCRGRSACYSKHGHKLEVQRCDDADRCPIISENDGNCNRQWWECGAPPSEQPPCTPKFDNYVLQFGPG